MSAVIGATLRPNALVAVGAEAVDALRMIRADVIMRGVCGLHREMGVTTNDLQEAHVKRGSDVNDQSLEPYRAACDRRPVRMRLRQGRDAITRVIGP
jgi:hypothetical protein